MIEVVKQESFSYPQNKAAMFHAVVRFDGLLLRFRKPGVRNNDRLDKIVPISIVFEINIC